MTDVFSVEQKAHAFKVKKKLWTIWFLSLALYLAIVLTLVIVDIYIVNTSRDRSPQVGMTIAAVAASIIFGCFSMFFFSIKFRLTSKFCRMLRDMERGLKDESEGKFVEYDNSISMKDGCYFYSMVLDAKPLKREDITIRKLLIERTVPKIEIEPGTRLKIKSHANILVSYEILPPKTGYKEDKPDAVKLEKAEAKLDKAEDKATAKPDEGLTDKTAPKTKSKLDKTSKTEEDK